jgi:hypothetical protein
MPRAYETWTPLPHKPIERLAENLWRVQGTLKGMGLRRVMTLARLEDGRLVIHNGIALEEDEMRQIEEWGPPAFLIVPNGYHRLDSYVFKKRYPDVKVLCPRAARKQVEQVVAVDGDYDTFPTDANVRLEHAEGVGEREGVMIVRSADGVTLVFNDLIFNMPHGKGLMGFVARHIMGSTGGPRITRLVRFFLVKDRDVLCAYLIRLSETPDLRRIIVSHHRTIEDDPARTLRRVAETV